MVLDTATKLLELRTFFIAQYLVLQ